MAFIAEDEYNDLEFQDEEEGSIRLSEALDMNELRQKGEATFEIDEKQDFFGEGRLLFASFILLVNFNICKFFQIKCAAHNE